MVAALPVPSACAQAAGPGAAAQSQQPLSAAALDQLVAPIALYPDPLLADVLMASTYPLEVVEAERWGRENKALKGDQLKAAVDKQQWDNSVKALVATPAVLTMMSTKLDWTQKLGDAVLAQQPDVMDAIQRLRAKAQANNKLNSTNEQKVSVRADQGKQTIVIEPTQPETIYVPYYNPAVVYGGWPYPAYPPYYFPPPGYIAGSVLAAGIGFGAGYAVGRWASAGNYWGGGLNWGSNNIVVNRPVNINTANVQNWQHDPIHRHAVRYGNASVQQRFGNNELRAGNQDRLDFRGRDGEPVLRPAGDRPGAGSERPNSGERGGLDRPDREERRERPEAESRAQRDHAFSDVQTGRAASLHAERGRESLGERREGAAARGGFERRGEGARHFGGGRRR